MMKETALRAFLDTLFADGQRQDISQQERSKKMLNLEPETAHLLHILARYGKSTHILEIGTSNGYSTIWLAWAASITGGRVISIDRDTHKQELANANLRMVGLRDVVELHYGDATEIVTQLPGPFDLVFFDADRYSAPTQLMRIIPKLSHGAMLLADNVLSHPNEIAGYLNTLETQPLFDCVILPVGKGLSLAYYKG